MSTTNAITSKLLQYKTQRAAKYQFSLVTATAKSSNKMMSKWKVRLNMMKSWEFLIVLLTLVKMIETIVNPNNETARMVIYLQKPNDMGPRTWLAGISCLDHFTKIYFKKKETLTRPPNMVLTSLRNMSTPAAQIQEGFLKHMMEAISETPLIHTHYQFRIVSDSKPPMRISMNQRELVLTDYYIIIIDSLKRLKALMRNYVSRMLSWNPGARFIVLYNNAENRNKERETAIAIFEEMLYTYYVHRVALLYATSATKYSFLLMDYYNVSTCRHLEVKQFAMCQEGRVVPDNLDDLERGLQHFLNTISLSNCTFYMCASIAAPFVEGDCSSGLELRIIGFIKNRLKFDINQSCEAESRGVEDTPGNWSGLLGRLNERSCDFILGGFYPDNDVINSFWVSDTYLEDSYTWFAKLADPRPPWMGLYAIFQNLTWLAFVVMIVITGLVWFILVNLLPEPKDSRELSLTFINSMAVSICVSVNERPICAASRIFFFFLAIYGLNLTATYTSKLIAVFTDPGYLHQIDTLDEVVEAGIAYGGHEESRDWFENEDDMWIFDGYNESSDFEPISQNLIYVKMGERVILSSRSYILQNSLADDIYAFPTNVFTSPIQMIMKPGFPFLYEFNLMIRLMRDFGIFEKINRDFKYNNTYLNRIAKMRPDFKDKVIVLTPDHLQGSFAILIVGVGASVIVLLGELITFYFIEPYFRHDSKLKDGKSKKSKKKQRQKPKQRKKVSKNGKTRKSKKKAKADLKVANVEEYIIIPWNDRNIFEIPIQKGLRFTPLKRRIVHNEIRNLKASK